MISERDRDRLRDMAVYARHAIDLLGDAEVADLVGDIRTQFAVRHAIEIVGEAASKVSDAGRGVLPGLPWRSIVGMRNAIIHGYAAIDMARVVAVVRHDLPSLITTIEMLLGKDGP